MSSTMNAARKLYIPLVFIDIKPTQNQNIVAIEKTHRTTTGPAYMVPLFKAKWGKGAQVKSRPMLDTMNPLYEILERNDPETGEVVKGAAEHEIDRLKRFFNTSKRDIFHEVYRDHEFIEMFEKLAKTRNPWLDRMAEIQRQADEAATQTAATTLLKTAGELEGKRAVAKAMREEGNRLQSQADAFAERDADQAAVDEISLLPDDEDADTINEAAAAAVDEIEPLPATPTPTPEIPRRGKK